MVSKPFTKSFALRAGVFFGISSIALVLAFLLLRKPVSTPCAPLPAAAVSPPQTIAVGLDINTTSNRANAIAAKNAIASSFENAVHFGQGKKTVYVTLLNHDSYNPRSTVMVLTIPQIDHLPAKPVEPVYSDDPYKAAEQRAAYQHALFCWNVAVTAANNHLNTDIKPAVHQEAEQLRTYQLPPADPGEEDADGFLVRAALWLNTSGSHELIIASGFRDSQEVNEYDGDVPGFRLPSDTVVQNIWYDCGDKYACATYTPLWQSVFTHAGASDSNIHFLDPFQSQTVASFF